MLCSGLLRLCCDACRPALAGRILPPVPPIDVLVVEDDDALREILLLHLRTEGFTARGAARGDDGLAEFRASPPDVVLLDIALPGLSGIDVCREIRGSRIATGVVMVTSRASELDVILGFDVGADDYVVKPCRPREICARIRALARRVRPDGATAVRREVLERGPLRIDLAARRVATEDGAEIALTATEYALLLELAGSPDVARSRSELLARVFDSQHEGYARNVDCHVTRVRRKLEQAGLAAPLIHTVHGVGYRFAADPPP